MKIFKIILMLLVVGAIASLTTKLLKGAKNDVDNPPTTPPQQEEKEISDYFGTYVNNDYPWPQEIIDMGYTQYIVIIGNFSTSYQPEDTVASLQMSAPTSADSVGIVRALVNPSLANGTEGKYAILNAYNSSAEYPITLEFDEDFDMNFIKAMAPSDNPNVETSWDSFLFDNEGILKIVTNYNNGQYTFATFTKVG